MTEESSNRRQNDGALGHGGRAGVLWAMAISIPGRSRSAGRRWTSCFGWADLRRGYRRAGAEAADGDGHAGEHTGGSDAGGAGESLLRRRQAYAKPLRRRRTSCCTATALSLHERIRRSALKRKTAARRPPRRSRKTPSRREDAFTETMRINTKLLRRHLRTAQLRFTEDRRSAHETAVTVCYLADLERRVGARMEKRLGHRY